MDDVKSLTHTKWNCKYHVVFAPKYRRREDLKGIAHLELVQGKLAETND